MRISCKRGLAAATAALLAIAMAPAAPFAETDSPGDDPAVNSSNMSWVAQVRYEEEKDDEDDVDEQGGTDLEIASMTVLGADGLPEERDYAFTGTYQNGFNIIDVTNPVEPVKTAQYQCDVRQGDIQVMHRPDMLNGDGLSRTFVSYAMDNSQGSVSSSTCYTDLEGKAQQDASTNSGAGSLLIDVTDPTAPRSVGFIPATGGTHNGTIQGFDTTDDQVDQFDTWLFYNSDNDAGRGVQVWNINDVAKPTLITTMSIQDSGTDTHDITFSEDGTRAYVASITNSYILNTEDPFNPTMVSRIFDPGNGIHHQADPITVATPAGDRTYVIISDEIAGAAGNGFCPGGGLHIWDVTVETVPVKVGTYFMPDIKVQEGAHTGAGGLVTCTSHVLRMYPDQQIMTIANMAGGVRVLDVSELIGLSVGAENMSTGAIAGINDLGWFRFYSQDKKGHDAWAFKAHTDRFEEDGSFYGFSNDQTRGFEVFRFDGSVDTATPAAGQDAERGRMATVAEALTRWENLDFRTDALSYSCRFPTGLQAELGL
jgi:hypothetical protein